MTEQQRRLLEAMARKGLKPRDIAARIGISQSAVSQWFKEDGKPTRPSREHLAALSGILGVTVNHLLADGASKTPTTEIRSGPPADFGKRDLPVFASARGGHGEMVVENSPMEYIDRPGELALVDDAFGVYLVGDSMWPKFEQGEILVVHPRRPVKSGDYVLVEMVESDGTRLCMVKLLVRIAPGGFVLRQFNPDMEIVVEKARVSRCMLIVWSRIAK